MIRDIGGDMADFWQSAWGMGALLIILISCQVTIWTNRINDSVSERIYCWIMSLVCIVGWLHDLEESTPQMQSKAMITATAVWLLWRCIRKITTPKVKHNDNNPR